MSIAVIAVFLPVFQREKLSCQRWVSRSGSASLATFGRSFAYHSSMNEWLKATCVAHPRAWRTHQRLFTVAEKVRTEDTNLLDSIEQLGFQLVLE